ncbi:MAG: HDOD domain-containing protein [Bryobacteraceae bacterium]
MKQRAFVALKALPPLSPVLHRVIASLAHEDISFAKVAELIEKDIALTGNILQLVNSPLYSVRGTVSSVRHAVSLLGVNKLRNAVLGLSAAQMWRSLKMPPGWLTADFNHHSVSVAILADLMSQHLPVRDGVGAFVGGLFHDLGLLLIAMGLPAEYKQISLLCEKDPQGYAEYELQVLGTTHSELCAEALGIWNLPQPIRTAVRYHTRPELDPAASLDGVTLSRIIHAANAYVGATTVRFCSMEDGADGSLESLGLGEHLAGVVREFENELEAIRPYF